MVILRLEFQSLILFLIFFSRLPSIDYTHILDLRRLLNHMRNLKTCVTTSLGAEVDDTGGDGPGSYRVTGNVWHLDCCSPENTLDGQGWNIFAALVGFTSLRPFFIPTYMSGSPTPVFVFIFHFVCLHVHGLITMVLNLTVWLDQ